MLTLRKAEDRGHTDLGWLSSYHTFSFGGYTDPSHMGFRSLRVLNDDRVAPGKGFGAHGHRDMEILSYVITGKLAHKDSMGEQHELGPNEVQAMSAGTGVIHSEFNGVNDAETHFLQIWIVPAHEGTPAVVSAVRLRRGREARGAAPDGRSRPRRQPPAAFINQDARMYAAVLDAGQSIDLPVAPGRYAWVHCVQGDDRGQRRGDARRRRRGGQRRARA